MGDDQDGAFVGDQVVLQPGHGFGVKVVRRLVEQQHVRGFQQQFAQRDPPRLATRQGADIGIVRRAAQRLHRNVDLRIQIPQVLGVNLVLQGGHFIGGFVGIVHRQFVIAVKDRLFGGHPQHDIAAHRQRRVQPGFLGQVADARAFSSPGLAGEILVSARHDPQQG